MTLGPALVFLGLSYRGIPRLARPLLVFGRVPLFYYVLHLLLVDLITVGFGLARYGRGAAKVFESGRRPIGDTDCRSSTGCGWRSWSRSTRCAAGTRGSRRAARRGGSATSERRERSTRGEIELGLSPRNMTSSSSSTPNFSRTRDFMISASVEHVASPWRGRR